MDKLEQSFKYLNIKNVEEEKIVITEPSERTTPNIISRFEVASILTQLTKEIADNKLDYPEDIIETLEEEHAEDPEYVINAYDIAEKLLEFGLTNLIVRREIGDNMYEYLLVDEMTYYST